MKVILKDKRFMSNDIPPVEFTLNPYAHGGRLFTLTTKQAGKDNVIVVEKQDILNLISPIWEELTK